MGSYTQVHKVALPKRQITVGKNQPMQILAESAHAAQAGRAVDESY